MKNTCLGALALLVCLFSVMALAQDTGGGSSSSAPATPAPIAPASPYSQQGPTGYGQTSGQQGANGPYGQQGQSGAQQGIQQQGPNTNQSLQQQILQQLQNQNQQNQNQQGKQGENQNQQGQQQADQLGSPGMVIRNDFQDFVEQSTGRALPMYGYDLFRAPDSFAPISNTPVPADYVVGPGDEINIRSWGQLDLDTSVQVDRDGNIFLPRVGNVMVAGLRYSQLTPHLRESISRVFKNFELSATISQIRTIQIYVVGHARRPGQFTVSSLSTLVNAVFQSGGPSATGSMRRIELRRGGKTVTTLDLYDLVAHGDISKDTKLQPGDIIYFPAIGNLVAIPDQVRVPAIYELNNETTLGDVIHLAGGFTTTTYTHEISIESIRDRQDRAVERFTLDDSAMKRPVKDGDILLLGAISPRFENAVTLRGNVARSGRYPFKPGMRVRDLIPSWQFLIAPVYWAKINESSTRISERGLPSDIRSEGINVNWDYALIERLNKNTLNTTLIPFNLGKAVLDNDPASNLELEPGDIVTVFSQSDLAVARSKRVRYVTVEGEFNVGGIYRLENNETLPHLIQRIGGFAPDAYPETLQLLRESLRKKQTDDLNQFIIRMESELQSSLSGTVSTAGPQGASDDLMGRYRVQKDMLERLKTLTPTGRVNLRLRADKDGTVKLPELELQDGDHISVGSKPETVSVIGMVFSGGDFGFRQGLKVGDYLTFAGGLTRSADKSKIYVVGANGESRSIAGGWFRGQPAGGVRPGDTIFVPEHPNPGQFMRDLKDWSQILGQFGLSAAAIKVLMQ